MRTGGCENWVSHELKAGSTGCMLEPSLKRKFWALYSEIIKNFSNCRALNQAQDPSVGLCATAQVARP